ncbi:MAG: hypothetical protein H6601_03225 [Flavobacteriales bacterium]|nr:hypothetical protein [Flavobacteriales bacterium]
MRKFLVIGLCLATIIGCQESATIVDGPVNVPTSGDFLKKLSEYHLFRGEQKNLEPNDGVLPYTLNSTLFTDYAHKARFVWMPEGKAAEYNPNREFDFPVGAILIKNFYYPFDFRDESKGRRIIETRLLINREDGWVGLPYIWNEEQTDAQLELAGGRTDVSWIHDDGSEKSINYVIPNKNQCKGCHEYDKATVPIGPKAKHLNRDFAYADGEMNQLEKWAAKGYLTGFTSKEEAPKLAVWDDESTGTLDARARAWLDINCAHCHNAEGPGNTSGFFLNIEETDCTKRGFYKTNVAAGRGGGQYMYDIAPGQPDSSIIVYRMESTDPGIMMPELGRKLVHEEAMQVIRQWISDMDEKHPCSK